MKPNHMQEIDWEQEHEEHIKKLQDNNFFIEAFYYYSMEIEGILQKGINYQEKWIENLLKKSKFNFKKNDPKALRDKPLGELIKIFGSYCRDEKLISRLNEFNSFRKKIVHHLSETSIDLINREAKEKNSKYYLLAGDLYKYYNEVLEKHIRHLKRQSKNK